MSTIIETDRLTKRFGGFTAVDSVSLQVDKGEIYGFLGLNGAGKTTTIRMLLGMIGPTAGRARLHGTAVGPDSDWNRVGYLVETPYAYPDLTVGENLELIRRLRGLTDAGSVSRVMDILHLTPYRDRQAKHLSLGNAQRLGLAKAVIHEPDILILDEPANGLDPAGIVEIRELLRSMARDRGVTVFVSSHILGEVSKFATRIGIIHEGKMVQELEMEQLETFRQKHLLVDTRDRVAARAVLEKNGHRVAVEDQGILRLTGPAAVDRPEDINSLLVREGCTPILLQVHEEDLESYFLRIIGRNGGGA